VLNPYREIIANNEPSEEETERAWEALFEVYQRLMVSIGNHAVLWQEREREGEIRVLWRGVGNERGEAEQGERLAYVPRGPALRNLRRAAIVCDALFSLASLGPKYSSIEQEMRGFFYGNVRAFDWSEDMFRFIGEQTIIAVPETFIEEFNAIGNPGVGEFEPEHGGYEKWNPSRECYQIVDGDSD
jgi:hypothetical protein